MTGRIGTINYSIIKQALSKDEITFSVPVTNITTRTQCYFIKLYNANGVMLEIEPEPEKWTGIIPILAVWEWTKFANKIDTGRTETMILNSNLEDWHIGDVAGQTVKFELYAIPSDSLTGYCSMDRTKYTLVNTKTYVMPTYEDEDEGMLEEAEDIMNKLIILAVVIIIAMLVAKFS